MADRWVWNLESSGDFSVSSIRKVIDEKRFPSVCSKTRWVKYVSIKVNVLAWKIKIDGLPTRFNISRRGIDIHSILCPVCDGEVESSEHLFFRCHLSKQIARKVSLWWNVAYVDVNSYAEWYSWIVSLRIAANSKLMLEGVFYTMWWQLWTYRNKLLFDDKVPSKTDQVSKLALWNRLQDFMHRHNGSYIMFGDINAIKFEQERVGSIFNNIKVDCFNSFIDAIGLVDLPIGGRCFTWMNKASTKLSKFDRFLISEDVIDLLPDIRITALDRIWSDHSPILLHVDKIDFGPTPFILYNAWLLRDGFDDLITSEWDSLDSNNFGFPIKCHEKFCILKDKIRQWNNNNKTMERNRKAAALEELSSNEKKIDEGSASPSDTECHTPKIGRQRNGNIGKDEIIGSIGILVGWQYGDYKPQFDQRCIFQFYKVKFQAQDSQVSFPNLPHSQTLNSMDRDYLERLVTHEEIKEDIIKKDLHDFINSFFASCDMSYGANSSFFTLIPKVNNPTLITDFRPISLIGFHYKIIAKILANRLSKMIDKIVSKEQSTFIAGPGITRIIFLIVSDLGLNGALGSKLAFHLQEPLFLSMVALRLNSLSIVALYKEIPCLPFFSFLVTEGIHECLTVLWFTYGSLNSLTLLFSKMGTRLFTSPNDLWVKVVKAFHGHEGGFDNNGCSFKGTWANIVGFSNFFHSKGIILNNYFRFNAGCGTRIRFWKDFRCEALSLSGTIVLPDQDKIVSSSTVSLMVNGIGIGPGPILVVRNLAFFCKHANEMANSIIGASEGQCV
ncbi:RNA-directed DNA polymerase, eukaryota, reverse transcriptase zinc-binding domain protein [Tanacetum coccineum]